MNNRNDEFVKKKRQIMTPLLVEAGAALMTCQGFEYGIALFLYYLSLLGFPNLDPVKMKAVMDDVEKKTAGQLLTLLKQHLVLTKENEEVYKNALDARNKLIHRILIDNGERMVDKNERDSLIREIRVLKNTVQKGTEILNPSIMDLMEKVEHIKFNDELPELINKFLDTADN